MRLVFLLLFMLIVAIVALIATKKSEEDWLDCIAEEECPVDLAVEIVRT